MGDKSPKNKAKDQKQKAADKQKVQDRVQAEKDAKSLKNKK